MNLMTKAPRGDEKEKANKCKKLWQSVVLACLDEWIMQDTVGKGPTKKTTGFGQAAARRWAVSRDGQTVLMLAGIDNNSRAVEGLVNFVKLGKRTSSITINTREPTEE